MDSRFSRARFFARRGELRMTETCPVTFFIYVILASQKVQNLAQIVVRAGKDGRVAQREAAAFDPPQLHDQVQEVLRLVGLEGDDEFLVMG